jgi:hypothetical protein
MSAAAERIGQVKANDFAAPIASTLEALKNPLMRARWAHGWKIPPQAFEPFSLAFVLGWFQRMCEDYEPIGGAPELYSARITLLRELLGQDAMLRLDETLQLVEQHEMNLEKAWQTGMKEADAQLGPERSIACSWREFMYLEIEHYSFSYPRD